MTAIWADRDQDRYLAHVREHAGALSSPFGDIATVTFASAAWHTLDPAAVSRMAAFLTAGVRLGTLRPAVDQIFSLDDVAEPHRHLEKGLHTGKIVVTV